MVMPYVLRFHPIYPPSKESAQYIEIYFASTSTPEKSCIYYVGHDRMVCSDAGGIIKASLARDRLRSKVQEGLYVETEHFVGDLQVPPYPNPFPGGMKPWPVQVPIEKLVGNSDPTAKAYLQVMLQMQNANVFLKDAMKEPPSFLQKLASSKVELPIGEKLKVKVAGTPKPWKPDAPHGAPTFSPQQIKNFLIQAEAVQIGLDLSSEEMSKLFKSLDK